MRYLEICFDFMKVIQLTCYMAAYSILMLHFKQNSKREMPEKVCVLAT